jgi:hypothetical protein
MTNNLNEIKTIYKKAAGYLINTIINPKKIEFALRKYFNPVLAAIYDIIGDETKEFVIGQWAFRSINDIISHHKLLNQFNQNNLIDIASKSSGMGWTTTMFIDKNLVNGIILLPTGGSSSWDRYENDKRILDYSYDNSYEVYTFEQLMEQI